MDLNEQINAFINYWAPHDDQREVFEAQLRSLLSEYRYCDRIPAPKDTANDTKKS